MSRKFLALTLNLTLLAGIHLCGNARTRLPDETARAERTSTSEAKTGSRTTSASSDKLKRSVANLISDAKSRPIALEAQSQPAKSNSLSKRTKIAIGVAVVTVVVLFIIYKHEKAHLFDNFGVR